MYRKKREADLADAVIADLVESFRLDWQSFIRVEVTDELNPYIDRLVERYPLRGFDVIHLASAVVVAERLPEDLLFICFDETLARAARTEKFKTFPPEEAANGGAIQRVP
jgi:hypothetical protein